MLSDPSKWILSFPGWHRVRLWPWTGSEIRLTGFFRMHKRCSCVPSKRFVWTALRLWAATAGRKLKVRTDSRDTRSSQTDVSWWITAGPKVVNITGPPFAPESFDRVLLDAPCSGLGQRPNMGSTWTLKEICSYQPLQRKLFHAVGFYHTEAPDTNSHWPLDGSIVQFLYSRGTLRFSLNSHHIGQIFFLSFP